MRQHTTTGTAPTATRIKLFSMMLLVPVLGFLLIAALTALPQPASASGRTTLPAPAARLDIPGVNEAQLAITKSVSDEPLLGGTIGYGITVRNTTNTGDPLEDDKAYNVSVTDTLPAGLTFTSASPAPSQVIVNPNGATTLVWTNIKDLEQQESTSLSIQATINPTVTLGQAIVNHAQAIANKAPDNSQAYITASTTVTSYLQAIDIEKKLIQSTGVNQATGASGWESTAPGTGAGPQWPYTYEISVRNNNVTATTDIIVTDVLPAGVAYLGPTTISPNPNGSTVTPTMVVQADGSLLMTWNLGTLTTNEYTNPPIIRFGVAIPYRQRVQSLVGCIRVPDVATYQDPGCFTGAIIADGSTWNNSYDASGIYSGTATFDGSTYTPLDDPLIPITAKYQTIAKSGTPGVGEYFDQIDFTLHYYVSEYYTMTSVVITDVIPDGLSYIAGSASVTPTSILTDTPTVGKTTLIWTIPATLTTPGRDGVITFSAHQDTTYVQTGKPVVSFDNLTNIVSIGGNWQDDVDPARTGTTTDGASSSVQTRGPSIDKKVRTASGIYVDGPITGTVGDIIEFRLSYVAPTRMDAKDNYLADFLPRGMSFVTQTQCSSSGTISNTFLSGDTDNTPCTYETYQLYGLNVVRWNYGYVSAGFTMTTYIRAHIDDVPEVADGVIVANFLKLSGVNTSGSAYSLRDMVNINYHEPYLVLMKEVSPSLNLSAGNTITYVIAITNTSVVTAYNSIMTDTVPQYVTVNTGSCTGSPAPASCVVLSGSPQIGAGGVISWTLIPTIGPGATQYLTYTAVITPGAVAGSSLTNTATVEYNSQPDNLGRVVTGTTDIADDNTDDATVTLSLPSIAKTASPSPVTIGDVVTFTLRVTVPAGVILPSAYITDVLNTDGIRYNGAYTVAVSGAALSPAAILATNVISSGAGITVGWSLGTIDNSNTNTQPYVFDVVFTTTVTGWNDAGSAWLNFPTATYNALNNASLSWIRASVRQSVSSNQTTTVINQPLLSLKKTAQPNTNLIGGQTLTFTLAMTNVGSSPAYNMVLTDVLPSGIMVAASGGTGSPFVASYSADAGAQAGTGGVLTFTTPVSLAVNSTQYFTFTAVISMPAVASTVLTNTSDVDWTSLPGSNPDARVYNDPTQEAAWTSDTSLAAVTLASITTAKTVSPTTANTTTSIRIGDIVTYTIVNTIPPQTIGYTPYQNDFMDQGFEYIPNSFVFVANPALTTTLLVSGSAPANITYGIVSGNNAGGANPNVGAYKTNTQQQAIEWWMTNYVNSTAVTQTITFTLQAQFTGVGLAGGVVSAPPNVTTPARANSERLYWNASNGGVYTSAGALSTALATVNTYFGQPNLALNKRAQTPAAGAVVGGNQQITYTLVITNNGYAPAYDVVLTETLPLSTTFVSAGIAGTNYPATTPLFTTTLTSVPAVGSTGVITMALDQVLGLGNTPGVVTGNNTTVKVVTMTFVVLTDPGLGANLTLTNTARVSYYDSQPGAGTDADLNATTPTQRTYVSTTPVAVTQLTVTPAILKTQSPITATIGQPIVYTILVPRTPLTVTLYNVSFTDVISSGLRLDAASVSGGVGSSLLTSGNNITATWTSILSNTQATVVISATVLDIGNNAAGRVITNTGNMVYASIPGGALNPVISSSVTLTETEPQLTIRKNVATSRSPVGASDIVTYTIVVTNTGANVSPAYDVSISDTLPAGVAFVSTVSITDTNPVTATLGGTYPVWTASQINSGGVVTVIFTGQVDANIGAGVVLTNSTRAYYTSMPGSVSDERSYTTTIATVPITTASPSGLSKVVSPITPTIGQPIVYTVTLPTPALIDTLYDVIFTDTMTTSLRLDSASFTGGVGGALLSSSNSVTITWTSIPSNTQATVVISATVLDVGSNVAGRVLTNTARFTYAKAPGLPQSTPLTATVTLTETEPQLVISKRVATPRSPVGASDIVTYTIVVTNTGANVSPAYDVSISDTLPAGVAFVSTVSITDTNPVTATLGGSYPLWTASQINPGGVVTVTFTGQVDANIGAGIVLTNSTRAFYTSMPGSVSDERSYTTTIATVPITTSAPVALTKAVDPVTATIGQLITYTLRLPNPAISTNLYDVFFTDTVPVSVSVTSVTYSGGLTVTNNSSANNVWLNFGVVPSNTQVVITITAYVRDIEGNVSSRIIANSGQFSYSPAPGGTRAAPIASNTVNVTIVEPALTISKVITPNKASASDTVTMSFQVSNIGTSIAYDVVISDPLPSLYFANISEGTTPAGFTFGTLASPPNTVVTYNGGPINVGQTITFAFTARLTSSVIPGNILTNVVTVTQYTTLPGSDPNERYEPPLSASAPLTVTIPDIVITKTDGRTTVVPGQLISYTLTVTNAGQGYASGVAVTETVPEYTRFNANASLPTVWSCANNSPAGTICAYTIGAMAPGATNTLTFALFISSPIPSAVNFITNTATAWDDGTHGADPTPANNTTTDIDTLNAAPDLVIAKTDGVTTAVPGQTLTYTISYTNAGNQNATGVVITETIPDNTTYVGSGWSLVSGQVYTRSIGSLAAGITGTVQITVQVNATIPAGVATITNTATIADDGTNGPDPTPANNTTSDIDTLTAAPDLVIGKTDGVTVTTPGSTLTYTISYTNAGNQNATGVVITETIPDNTTYVGSGWSLVSGQVYTRSIGSLAAGITGTVQITVQVNATIPAGVAAITNTATIADDGTNGPDPTPANNTTSDIDTLTAAPDLVIGKTDGVTTVVPGQTLTYTISYTNAGNRGATGVVITETIPDYTTYVGAGWSLVSGQTYTRSIGSVAAGAAGTVLITVQISATIPAGVTAITNTATIADDGTNGPDPTPANNTATDVDTLTAAPDLVIGKTDGVASAVPGQTLTYTISYTNAGNQNATGVVITETIPDNTTYIGSGWSTVSTQVYTLSIGSLAAGASGTVQITVHVSDTVPAGVTAITNTTTIADDGTNGTDPTPDNNMTTDVDTLNAAPDLAVTKTDFNVTGIPGGFVTYTISYSNTGNQDASGVVLTETIPDNTSYVGYAWTLSSGSLYTYNVGAIAPGASGQITIVVRVTDTLPVGVDIVTNTVHIADDGTNGPDPTPENNVDEEPTIVLVLVDLQITKSDNGVSTAPGSALVYTLTYTNAGNVGVTGAFITETVPAYALFNQAAITSTMWSCADGSISGTLCLRYLGALPAGVTGTVSFAVTVTTPLPAGVHTISNTVRIGDDGKLGADQTPGDNIYTEITPIVTTPDLQITKTDGGMTATVGAALTYTLNYTNVGNIGVTGVVLTETIPANTEIFTPSLWTCLPNNSAGSTCTLNAGALAAGASNSATFVLSVSSPLSSSVKIITNTVAIGNDGTNGADGDPSDNTAQDTTPLQGAPDLVITKTDGGVGTTPNGVIVYTLNYTNVGNIGVTNVTISETVPTATRFNAGASLPTVWTCNDDANGNPQGSICSLNVGTLEPGQSGVVSFAVTVYNPLPPSIPQILNRAAITDDGTHGPDAHPQNNTAEDTTPVTRAPDLRITKESTSTITAGGLMTWTLYYSNTGNVDAANTIITETVPNNTRYAAAANTTLWSCADGSIAGTICAVNVGTVPGLTGSGSVTFVVRVENPLPASVTTISNTVRILDDGTNGADPTPPNNITSAQRPIVGDASTVFYKVAWHDPVTPGWASQRYTIIVHNTGVTTITGMVLTDVIPVYTQYLESTIAVTGTTLAPQFAWFAPGGVWDGYRIVTWNVGDVPPGWWAEVRVRVRVMSNAPVGTMLVNTAYMSASSGASGVTTNSVRVIGFSTTPTPTATATATPTPTGGICAPEAVARVNAGATITYTDNAGNIWLPDQAWVTGTTTWGYTGPAYTYTNSTTVSGTLDQPIYQTERWWTDDGGYQFAVANGNYRVVLKFAEIYPYVSTGSRVFGIRVEGATILPYFDVVKAANGKFTAFDVTIDTLVNDGKLNLDFAREVGTPALQGIAVYYLRPCGSVTPGASPTQRPTDTTTATATPTRPPAVSGTATATRSATPSPTPTATATTYRLDLANNAGGTAYTDGNGYTWRADQAYTSGGWGYSGGQVYTTNTGTNGTDDDALYQSQRYWQGNGAYRFTVPNGTYNVHLRFAEIYQWTARGERVFDIRMENTIVRSGIDVVATVGLNAPLDITISGVSVTDGILDIEFLARKGQPIINAIRITQ